MATVFRAHQISVNRYVALKVIDLSLNQEEREEFRTRFEQEAAVVALLEHIHILPVYAYGVVENEFTYLAMRLLRGGSLADLLRKGPLPQARAVEIFSQVGRGLEYAHRKGVIHRDLKPSNILLDDAGNAYLSDFGLAKMMGSTLNLTKSGNLVGTPAYVSPEQVRGEPADDRSDIYSLGILLYHMFVGRPPFELSETGIAALLYKHVEEAPPPPHLFNPEVTPQVEVVILRALEKDPDLRYQSAEEMVNELNAALGRKVRDRSFITLRTPERLRKIHKNRSLLIRRAIFAVVLMLLLALTATAIYIFQTRYIEKPVQIISGERGVLADVTPNDSEISAARARLGDSGFIAYYACTLDTMTQAQRAREMSDMAAAFGLAYKVYNANNDAALQAAQLKSAQSDGATAVVLCPLDINLLSDSISALKAANIPLAYLTLVDNTYYGVKQDTNNYSIGQQMGRLASQIFKQEQKPPATVVLLNLPGSDSGGSRTAGMEDGFKENEPDGSFLGPFNGYTQDDGYASIKQLLDDKTSFNVILSMTDAGAYGAVKALQEAGIPTNSVIIISANGESYAQELIREGEYLRGTVEVNHQESSQIAVDAIVKMLAGSPVPETITVTPGNILTRDVLIAKGNS